MSDKPQPQQTPPAEKTSEKQQRKRKSRKVSTMYDVDYKANVAKLRNRKCPRCGKTMAEHANVHRWSCGGCGYTEYVRK